jgi:hypothetical protein
MRIALVLTRLVCLIEPENIASISVATRIGMTFGKDMVDALGPFKLQLDELRPLPSGVLDKLEAQIDLEWTYNSNAMPRLSTARPSWHRCWPTCGRTCRCWGRAGESAAHFVRAGRSALPELRAQAHVRANARPQPG